MKIIYPALIAILLINSTAQLASCDEKMDAAVAEMKQVLQSANFPIDMFAQDPMSVDAVQVNTTWWAIQPDMTRAFRKYFSGSSQPVGSFYYAETFCSADEDFQKAVRLAIWGIDDKEYEFRTMAAVVQGVPAEIKKEFQNGTRLDLTGLANHIQSQFEAADVVATIDAQHVDTSKSCSVTTIYRQPPEGLHAWYRANMEWAVRIRVTETAGGETTVDAGRGFTSAKSRIVLRGYIVVRAVTQSRAIEIGPVYEQSLRKHGSDRFNLLGQGWKIVAASKPKDQAQKPLQSPRPSQEYAVAEYQTDWGIPLGGPFIGRNPLMLMMHNSVARDYVAPFQVNIANSLLADPSLSFENAGSPTPKPIQPTAIEPPPAVTEPAPAVQ